MAQNQSLKLMKLSSDLRNCVAAILESANLPKNEPFCCLCKQLSTLKCSNCGIFYCSEACQDQDWPDHRISCLQKPPLVEVDSQVTNISNSTQYILQAISQYRTLVVACEHLIEQLNYIGSFSCNAGNLCFQPLNTQTIPETASIQTRAGELPIQRPIQDAIVNNVVIVCFGTLNKVYVCPENNYATYLEGLRKVEQYGETAPFLQRLPSKHSLVVCLRGGRFCRAKVVSTLGDNKVRVSYIDLGNVSIRPLVDLRQINLEIADLPIHVAEVTLKDVANVQLSSTLWRTVLTTFERKTYEMKNQNRKEVELIDVETGKSLNEYLNAITKAHNQKNALIEQLAEKNNIEKPKVHFADPLEKTTKVKEATLVPVMNAPFVTNVISRSDRNQKAIVIDTAMIEYGYVTCILKRNLKEFNDLQLYLGQKAFDQDQPYVPQHGEYVIAEYRNEWFRGLVVGVQPDGKHFEIFYVDFLNQETVSSNKIRHYPADLTIACNTQLCAFSALPFRGISSKCFPCNLTPISTPHGCFHTKLHGCHVCAGNFGYIFGFNYEYVIFFDREQL